MVCKGQVQGVEQGDSVWNVGECQHIGTVSHSDQHFYGFVYAKD